MASDVDMLNWMGGPFGAEDCKEKVLEWFRQTFAEEDDALNRDVMEVAHLFVVLGWMERRLFSQQLAKHDLTIPQFFTLLAIQHCGEGCTMGLLAERTHQCSATITGIIDRLLRMGLVERERAETDRRLVLVQITEGGKHVLQESLRTRFDALRKFLLQLDESNRQQLISVFKSSLALMKTELENILPIETPEESTTVSC